MDGLPRARRSRAWSRVRGWKLRMPLPDASHDPHMPADLMPWPSRWRLSHRRPLVRRQSDITSPAAGGCGMSASTAQVRTAAHAGPQGNRRHAALLRATFRLVFLATRGTAVFRS